MYVFEFQTHFQLYSILNRLFNAFLQMKFYWCYFDEDFGKKKLMVSHIHSLRSYVVPLLQARYLYVNICRKLNFFDEILNLRHKGSLMGNAFLSVFFHPKSVKSSICMHFACHTLANMEGDAKESGLFLMY